MAYNGQNTASQYWAQTDEIHTPPQYRFPEKLKAYVRRTFEDCERDARAEVMVELKQIITDAFNENVVWCLEWDKMPLPQETLAIKARAKEFAG